MSRVKVTGAVAAHTCPSQNRNTSSTLVSLDLVHQVAQRLPFGKARYVVEHQLVIARAHAIGHGGDMRRDDHVLEFPERVALGKRLGIRYIHSRAGGSPFV